MNIFIQTIEHKKQRYDTCGDWYQGQLWGEDGGEVSVHKCNGDETIISVSELGDWRFEMLIGVHETIEMLLCKKAGITADQVDAFDKEFEDARQNKKGKDGSGWFQFRGNWFHPDCEPGDYVDAPYFKQHQFATTIERALARELDVDWAEYEKKIEAL